jgi:hypothetical protein
MPRLLTVNADGRTPAEREVGAPLPGTGAQAAFLQKPRVTRAALSLIATPIVLIIVVATAVIAVGAILKHHETEVENEESRLVAVSDPDSHSPPTAACPCSLSGRAVPTSLSQARASALKPPARGTEVSVFQVSDPVRPVATVTTGASGEWRMDGVPPGVYLVRLTAPQRIPTWYPQAVDAAHATAVTVSSGLTSLRPMVIGIALASITVVLDVDDPSDVEVTVRLGSGSVLPGAIVATAGHTGTPSAFRADNIPSPGRFVVVAEKKGYLTASTPVDLALGQHRDVDSLALRPDPALATAAPTDTPTATTAPTATPAPSASPSPAPTTLAPGRIGTKS